MHYSSRERQYTLSAKSVILLFCWLGTFCVGSSILVTNNVILFHSIYQRLLANASGRENILWYNRRLRELGEEYYEEVRVIRAQLENHHNVHRRRQRELRKYSQPK